MKSKKLISLLCAAAMTTSAFAGLTISASAAATPLLELDGTSTSGWSTAPTINTDDGDSYLDFIQTRDANGLYSTYTMPTAVKALTDNYVVEFDTNIHAGNGQGRLNQYTQLAFTGANPVQDSQNYGGDYATAAQAVNPDTLHAWNGDDTTKGIGYVSDIAVSLTSRVELLGNMIVNLKDTAPSLTDGDANFAEKWVRVRAVVSNGKATVTVADSNGTIIDGQQYDANATSLSQIMLVMGRADTVNFIPTTASNIKLDNIKVYGTTTDVPAFSTTGLRVTEAVATPIPPAETVAGAAPALSVPDNDNVDSTTVKQTGFNNLTEGTLASVTAESSQAPVDIGDMMSVQVGTRTDGADTMTYAKIAKLTGTTDDKALKLQANKFSTNGRGPVVSLKDNLEIDDDDLSTNAVMGFSVYLSKTESTGTARMFLLDNVDDVDGNNVAREILGVLTEEEEATYSQGETNVAIHVTPNEWHTVVVAVCSDDKYRIFIDGKYQDSDGRLNPALVNDLVGTGEGAKYQVTHLPLLAVENTKASSTDSDGVTTGGTAYSSCLVDNVLTYTFQGDIKPVNLPESGEAPEETASPATPVPTHKATITYADNTATITTTEEDAFDGVLITAKYKADGTLDSVTSQDVTGLSATNEVTKSVDALANGDKIMLWNNLTDMVPYASLTVTGSTVTPEPGHTPRPTSTPTATPTATPEASPEASPTTTPTATTDASPSPSPTATTDASPSPSPTATATDAPTYTVSGTVDAGVASVALTPTEGDAITGSISGTTVSFSNVPAGTYTVTVTAKDGYKNPVSTPATITVSADATGAFEATTEALATSAVTIGTAENVKSITVKNGGTDVASGTEVQEGTTLTAAAVAADGYEATLIVTKTGDANTVVSVGDDGTFKMPAYPVTVSATAEYTGEFTFTPDATYVNFQTASADTSYEGVTPLLAGYVQTKNGGFMETQQTYEDDCVMTIVSIDASDFVNKIDDAVLTFGGQSTGAGTTVRYGTYSNYIDIADEDVTVKASNVNDLGGTAAIIGDVGSVNTTSVTNLSLNIKDILKSDADGKVTLVLLTSTGRKTSITDLKVTINAAQTAYETATAVVHTVYADENGSVDIDGTKYTEFGTATSKTMYAGDKFTPTYTEVIDAKDTDSAKYTYVSGAVETTLAAGVNDIYLVYTRELYSTVTFTAKLGDTATAGVPIIVTTDAGVEVGTFTTPETDADAGTTVGVVSTKLLAGSYKYTVAATANYAEITDGTFNVTAEGTAVPVEVTLQPNTTKYSVTVNTEGNGTVTTSVTEDKAVQGEEVTITTTPSTEDSTKTYVVKSITVSYNDGEEKTANVTKKATNEYTFTMPAADVTITVVFEEWDGSYLKEDFSTVTTYDTNLLPTTNETDVRIGTTNTIKWKASQSATQFGAKAYNTADVGSDLPAPVLTPKNGTYLTLYATNPGGGRAITATFDDAITNAAEVNFDLALPSVQSDAAPKYRLTTTGSITLNAGSTAIATLTTTSTDVSGNNSSKVTGNNVITVGDKTLTIPVDSSTSMTNWINVKITYDADNKQATVVLTPTTGDAVTATLTIDAETVGDFTSMVFNADRYSFAQFAIDNLVIRKAD